MPQQQFVVRPPVGVAPPRFASSVVPNPASAPFTPRSQQQQQVPAAAAVPFAVPPVAAAGAVSSSSAPYVKKPRRSTLVFVDPETGEAVDFNKDKVEVKPADVKAEVKAEAKEAEVKVAEEVKKAEKEVEKEKAKEESAEVCLFYDPL